MKNLGIWIECLSFGPKNESVYVPFDSIDCFISKNGNYTKTIVQLKTRLALESVEHCAVLVNRYETALRQNAAMEIT